MKMSEGPKALNYLEYYYDPPSWKVCPKCKGNGYFVDRRIYDDRYKNTCALCKGKGYLPIRYTPKEWVEAKGDKNESI